MAQKAQNLETNFIYDYGKLAKNMAKFVMNERFSDVKFLIGDEQIYAHKVVLAGHSDYFDSMLSDSKEIKMDVPLRAFQEILKYIYFGTVSISSDEEMLVDVLKLAHEFSLNSLETFVTEKMSAFIDSSHVCQTLNTANVCNLQELRDKCLSFIDENISEILKNNTLCSLSQASMVTLLERDDFPLPEIEVFKVVEQWCKVNTDKDNLVKNCIRLTCLTETEIFKIVGPSKLIEDSKLFVAVSQLKDDNFKNDQHRKFLKHQSFSSTPIKVNSVIPQALKNLGLSEDNLTQRIGSVLTAELESAIKVENVCSFLNAANSCALAELEKICHDFIRRNFSKVTSNGNVQQLSRESLIRLLKCGLNDVPEIEIFKLAEKWCKDNNNVDEVVLECIRFSLLSVEEMILFVWPTNLLNTKKLLQFISEIVVRTTVVDENVACLNRGAQVIAGTNTDYLLTKIVDRNYYAHHFLKDDQNIVIKLDRPYRLNHIKMHLYEVGWEYQKKCVYSYHIEISRNGKKWSKVVDHDFFPCRSLQRLYFSEKIVRFIKIVGTKSLQENQFGLLSFEAFLKNNIPTIINGIVRPEYNVATFENGALCIEGVFPERILNGNPQKGFTWHKLSKGSIVIQLAQPYLISFVKLRINEEFTYKYRIETSINKTHWELVLDKTDDFYTSWQEHTFSERPVIYIRIVGTSCQDPKNSLFYLIHFECMAK